MKKTIIFVLPNLESGGVEKVALNYMRQLDSKKYNINLIVFNKTTDLLDLVPTTTKIINLQTNSTKYSVFSVIRVFYQLKPDVVYTGHSRVAVLIQIVKLFTKRFQHLARMQSMPSLEKKYNRYGCLHRFLYAQAFQRADIVLAETDEMKQDVLESFSVKAEKVRVMHNPIDTVSIDKSINNTGNVVPFEQESLVGVASGRLCSAKGYDVLIKATERVLKVYPDFKLYILGRDDGIGKYLQSLISNNKLQDHVFLEGFQANPYKYYNMCRLFILSSRREGFPNVLLENYYLNTPIVATKCVPIIDDLIINGVNGYKAEVENVNSLSTAVINCIENLKRENIQNAKYIGSQLKDLF